MSKNNAQTDLLELGVLLKSICSQKKTGTAYLMGQGEQVARFVIKEGAIVSIFCHGDYGLAAIPHIQLMGSGQFGFNQDLVYIADGEQELPNALDVIRMVQGKDPVPSQKGGGSSKLESSQMRTLICDELTEYLGPMASYVFEEKLRTHGRITDLAGLQQFLASLSQDIGDETKAKAFRDAVVSKLRRR